MTSEVTESQESITPAQEIQSANSILSGPTEETKTEEVDWRGSLSEELKASKALQSFKSVEDLAKSYINAQSLVGKRVEDLTPEQLASISSKFGKPESPDKYEFNVPKEANGELVDWFKKTAHDAGLSQSAAAKLLESYQAMESAKMKELESVKAVQQHEQLNQLKKEFGPAFQERAELAHRAVREFGGQELIDMIESSGMGNNPTLVKAFAKIGALLSEGNAIPEAAAKGFGMTPDDASRKIEELRKDASFMGIYKDTTHPRHTEYKQRMEDLYKVKFYSAR